MTKEELLAQIENERHKLVDIGKITWRQLELCINAVHDYQHIQASLHAKSNSDDTLYWDNFQDLKNLEKHLWTFVEAKWDKERETNKQEHLS